MMDGLLSPNRGLMVDWMSPVNWQHPLMASSLGFWMSPWGVSGGPIIHDLTRLANAAKLVGVPPWGVSMVGVAPTPHVAMDGSSQLAYVAADPRFDITTITLIAGIRRTAFFSGNNCLLHKWDTDFSPARYPWTLQKVATANAFAMRSYDGTNAPVAEPPVSLPLNEWTLICGRRVAGVTLSVTTINQSQGWQFGLTTDTTTGTTTNGLGFGIGARPTAAGGYGSEGSPVDIAFALILSGAISDAAVTQIYSDWMQGHPTMLSRPRRSWVKAAAVGGAATVYPVIGGGVGGASSVICC